MKSFLKNVLFIIFIIFIAIFVMNSVYKKIGYGYFKKALSKSGITFFTRDSKIKYSDMNSYKIENKDYNNATFYKKIKLNKNTPYRVTCMVKTENVEVLNRSHKNSGAKISILGSDEQSVATIGTCDWKKITLMFNSKNVDEISIGFMLGGDGELGNVKGTAWFSDLSIEQGHVDENNNWNFACFVLKNTDVNLFDSKYKYIMSINDVNQICSCMERFQKSCEELSSKQMTVSYRIIEIDSALTELSYDREKGYYINPDNVSKLIEPYIQEEHFDHIFICARLNDDKSCIPIKNWIGLGGMEYNGIGFSNIRMPTSEGNHKYIYNEKSNRFPEEVFVHEFLHTLENNSTKYGLSVPALHDNSKYGYEEISGEGLYKWYKDYMTMNIANECIGLNNCIYKYKPVDEENFVNAINLNEFEDVKNIFERFKLVMNTKVTDIDA